MTIPESLELLKDFHWHRHCEVVFSKPHNYSLLKETSNFILSDGYRTRNTFFWRIHHLFIPLPGSHRFTLCNSYHDRTKKRIMPGFVITGFQLTDLISPISGNQHNSTQSGPGYQVILAGVSVQGKILFLIQSLFRPPKSNSLIQGVVS